MIESTFIEYDVADADSVNARFVPQRLNDLTINLNVKKAVRTTVIVTATVILTKTVMDTTSYVLWPYVRRLTDKMGARADKLEAENREDQDEVKSQ